MTFRPGPLTMEQRASARWKELLEEYEEPGLPADVDRDLCAYVDSL